MEKNIVSAVILLSRKEQVCLSKKDTVDWGLERIFDNFIVEDVFEGHREWNVAK